MTIHPQDVHRLHAQIAGRLAAEPDRRIAAIDVPFFLPDADELVAAPVPAPAPRRQRKRSLAKVCEAARRAGADRVIVDGVVIALSPAAAVPESDANEWDAVLSEDDHGPH